MSKAIKNNISMLKYVWECSKSYFIISCINTVIESLKKLYFIAIFPGLLINAVVEEYSIKVVLCFFIIYGLFYLYDSIIASYLNNVTKGIYTQNLHSRIQKLLCDKAKEIDIKNYDEPTFYDNYIWVMNETESTVHNSMNILLNLFGSLFSVCTNYIIVIKLNPVSLIIVITSLLISFITQKKIIKLSYMMREKLLTVMRKSKYIKDVFLSSNYARELKTSNISRVLFKKQQDANIEAEKIIKTSGFMRVLAYFILNANYILLLQTVLYLYLLFLIWGNHGLSTGDFIIITTATMNSFVILSSIGNTFTELENNDINVNKFKKFMLYKSDIVEDKSSINISKFNNILFEGVSFSYTNDNRMALTDISVSIEAGEKVAIVGNNGSGKSTFIQLLLRFYDTTKGVIKVNQENIKVYNLINYRKTYGVIFQDFQCYSMSIIQNVLMREIQNQKKDEEIVWAALKKSGLYKKVRNLPQGINTIIGKEFDDGVIFSGGEMQKLAIARVYANNYDVIILDEPTASLDIVAEYEFYQQIIETFKDKTIIFVSHQLAISKFADKILYFDNGSIQEIGTHHELINSNNQYAKIYNAQMKELNEV